MQNGHLVIAGSVEFEHSWKTVTTFWTQCTQLLFAQNYRVKTNNGSSTSTLSTMFRFVALGILILITIARRLITVKQTRTTPILYKMKNPETTLVMERASLPTYPSRYAEILCGNHRCLPTSASGKIDFRQFSSRFKLIFSGLKVIKDIFFYVQVIQVVNVL